MKRFCKSLVSLLLMLSLLCCALPVLATDAVSANVADIQKYGNLVLSIKASDLLNAGYAYGDIITVTINGQAYDMPIGTNYSDVDNGNLVCRAVANEAAGEDYVILAINMGDLATTANIATKTKIDDEPGYRWDYNEGIAAPVSVAITLKEAGGYYAEFLLHQLSRTNERADYAHLTDEEFANFRAVSTTGMGENMLFRSSSPINPELARNAYADAALKTAGIKTVINLADAASTMATYEGFTGTAYADCNIIALNLGVDVTTPDFQSGLADGLRFLIKNEGPYLVHCTEGKDRAGFVSALLECLMGATIAEISEDYMTTYVNYYGLEKGDDQYNAVLNSNIIKTLSAVFDKDVTEEGVDLSAEAREYLVDALGLNPEEIQILCEKLAAN